MKKCRTLQCLSTTTNSVVISGIVQASSDEDFVHKFRLGGGEGGRAERGGGEKLKYLSPKGKIRVFENVLHDEVLLHSRDYPIN